MEINLNTNLIMRIERKKVARHFNIIGCCDVFFDDVCTRYARAFRK